MQRIVVMGPPGSGKSTMAQSLGASLGLPVFHLDQSYWRPGWVLAEAFETTRARIRRVLLSLAQEKIVTLFPGRGAFIAAPSQTEAREINATRLLLEVGLLEQRREPIGDVV